MSKKMMLVIIQVAVLSISFFFIGKQAKAAGRIYYIDNTIADTYLSSGTPDCSNYNPVAFACSNGSASAYRTIADINAGSFSPDDQILFRKGQTWREEVRVPSSGTSSHPIIFGAFGSGKKPLILGSISKNDIKDWTQAMTNLYYASVTRVPKGVWRNGTILKKVTNRSDLNATNQWWWDSSNSRVYIYSTQNPIMGGDTFEIGQRDHGVKGAYQTDYITINNLDIRYTNRSGVFIDIYQDHWTVSNNSIGPCWGDGIRAQNATDYTITGNTVSYCGINDESDTADEIGIFFWNASNITISQNTVDHTGRAGILVGGASGRAVIDKNIVYNPGQNGNHAYGIQIFGNTDGDLDNVIIKQNYVHDCGNVNIYLINKLNNIIIYGNLLVNAGGQTGDDWANITGNGDGAAYPVKNLKIYNNTLVQLGGMRRDNIRIHDSIAWEGALIKNNIFYNEGTSYSFTYRSEQIHSMSPTLDYNLHYAPNTVGMLRVENRDYQWGAKQPGFETHGINFDPKFLSSSSNFALQSSSPAINAGINLGSPYNLVLGPLSNWPNGVIVVDQSNYGSSWEMGAFVYLSTTAGLNAPTNPSID